MIVVADSGPIIHLSMVGHLELLHKQFGEVLITEAVYQEVVGDGDGRPGSSELSNADWCQVCPSPPMTILTPSLAQLDIGERESIGYALAHQANWLLIDEIQGRLVATQLGLRVVGTIGILVAGLKRGEISELAPILVELKQQGFWMGSSLVRRVLSSVGETEAAGSWE